MVSPNFQSMKSKNSWEIINYHAQWRTLHAIYAGENFTLLVKEWNAESYSEQMCENSEIPQQLLSGYSLKWVFGFSKVNSRESLKWRYSLMSSNRILPSNFCHRLLKNILLGCLGAICRNRSPLWRAVLCRQPPVNCKTMPFIISFVFYLQACSVPADQWPVLWNIHPLHEPSSSLSVFFLCLIFCPRTVTSEIPSQIKNLLSLYLAAARDFCWSCPCLPVPPCHNIWFPLMHSLSFVSP